MVTLSGDVRKWRWEDGAGSSAQCWRADSGCKPSPGHEQVCTLGPSPVLLLVLQAGA